MPLGEFHSLRDQANEVQVVTLSIWLEHIKYLLPVIKTYGRITTHPVGARIVVGLGCRGIRKSRMKVCNLIIRSEFRIESIIICSCIKKIPMVGLVLVCHEEADNKSHKPVPTLPVKGERQQEPQKKRWPFLQLQLLNYSYHYGVNLSYYFICFLPPDTSTYRTCGIRSPSQIGRTGME